MSQTGFGIVPTDNLEKLNCFNRLSHMRQQVESKFKILKNEQMYVQVPKTYVNSVLFALFVKIDRLNKEKNKKLFEQKVRPENQIKIRSMLQKISKPSLPTSCKQGEFLKHVRSNIETVIINEALIETSKEVWDQLASNDVSNPYDKAYFKQIFFQERFTGYPVPNSHEQIKRVFVVQFEETKDSCVLCFVETQKAFMKKQIDEIMEEAMTQKFQIKEVKQKIIQQKPGNKLQEEAKPKKQDEPPKTPNKKSQQTKEIQQKSNQTQSGQEEMDLKQVQKQLKKAKPKRTENFLSFTRILLMILLSLAAFETWAQHEYYQKFNSGEINELTYSLSPSQLKTQEVWNFLAKKVKPLKKSVVEGYEEYVKPRVEFTCGWWKQVKAHPTVKRGLQLVDDYIICGLKSVKRYFDELILNRSSKSN